MIVMAKRKKSSSKFLTADEELRLIALAQAGDESARNELIERHYRFIWKATARHLSRQRMFTPEEMVGEAVIGYMRAIEKFDLERGIRLNTYADYWIRNHLQTVVGAGRHAVTVPKYIQRGGVECIRGEQTRSAAAAAVSPAVYLSHMVDDSGQPQELPQPERHDDNLPFTPTELHAAIRRLPKQAQNVVCKRMSGRTFAEIGIECDISRSQAQAVYMKSLARLGQLLINR